MPNNFNYKLFLLNVLIIMLFLLMVHCDDDPRIGLRNSRKTVDNRKRYALAEYVQINPYITSIPLLKTVPVTIKYRSREAKVIAVQILAVEARGYQWEIYQDNQSINEGGSGIVHFHIKLPSHLQVGEWRMPLILFAHRITIIVALVTNQEWNQYNISSVHSAIIQRSYSVSIWHNGTSRCKTDIIKYKKRYCKKENEVTTFFDVPVAFSGEHNGIISELERFHDPALKVDNFFKTPSVTVSLWLYISKRCQNPLCSIIFRKEDQFLTPHLYEIRQGNLHLQIELSSGKPFAFLSPWKVPLNKWVNIVLTVCDKLATLYMAPDENTLLSHQSILPEQVGYRLNHRFWTFGGNQNFPSFRGYLSKVTIFRRHCIHYDWLPVEQREHPKLMEDFHNHHEMCIKLRRNIRRVHMKYYLTVNPSGRHNYAVCPSYMWSILRKKLKRFNWCRAPVKRVVEEEIVQIVNVTMKANHKNGTLHPHPLEADTISFGNELYIRAFTTLGNKARGKEESRKAFNLLDYAGCIGSSDALYFKAILHINGIGTELDLNKGLLAMLMSSLEGNQLANMALGFRFANGIDRLTKTCNVAYAYLKASARRTREDLEAHRYEDVAFEPIRLSVSEHLEGQQGLEDGYVQFIKYQAEKGFTTAQAHMASLLFWGNRGVKRDLKAAVRYYDLGAKTEDPDAIYNMGIVHLRGQGVERNIDKAVEYLEKAAKLGSANAMYALGWIAANIDVNHILAAHYYQKATQRNHPEATFNLGSMHFHGLLNNGTKDDETALKYFIKAANLGSIDGSIQAAELYVGKNKYIKRSCDQAVRYVDNVSKKSPMLAKTLRQGLDTFLTSHRRYAFLFYLMVAEAGIEFAQFNAAFVCENYYHEIADCEDSVWRQYNLSAVQGYAPAKVKIADAHWYGLQGRRDSIRAIQLYKEAAEQRDPQGYFNLGWLIESNQIDKRANFTFGTRNLTLTNGNLTTAAYFYERCFKSQRKEAHIPCAFAYAKVSFKRRWRENYILISIMMAVIAGALGLFGYYNACGDCLDGSDDGAFTVVTSINQ